MTKLFLVRLRLLSVLRLCAQSPDILENIGQRVTTADSDLKWNLMGLSDVAGGALNYGIRSRIAL